MKKLKTAILGATGTVGQRMIQMLEDHPWFEIQTLAASDNSAGKAYGDAAHWQLETPIPAEVAKMTVKTCGPGLDCDFVLSGLPSSIADSVEPDLAAAGYAVISNASSHRMDSDVPLLVPEINAEHVAALEKQRQRFGGKGFIVTNPNCSTIGLIIPLAALERAFGLEAVHVVTMQALSGAGYPGVASLDVVDNVLPNIARGEEEEKLETEPLKILGSWNGDAFEDTQFRISAMTHRVNVRDGHLEACSVKLKQKPSREVLEEACARLDKATLLGFSTGAVVRGPEEGLVLVRALWRAVVSLGEWEPRHETSQRLLVPPSKALTYINPPQGLRPILQRWFHEALAT